MGGSSKPKTVAPAAPAPQVRPAPVAAVKAPAMPNVFGQASRGLTDAMAGARAAMAYQPERVSTTFGYDPQNVTAQSAVGGIETYMNPYTQQVIDTSLADLERQRLMQQNQLGAQASAAGAFGGSRQGVAEALTNEAFAQQGGQLAAQLRQQGFQTALGASQQDIANQLQAALANQGAFARAQEFGQATGLQAQGMNQQAGLQGAQLRLSGSGQLGGLAQTGFNMGQAIQQQQAAQGLMQQQLNQNLINASRAQYGGFTGAPAASLGLPFQALGAANMGQQTQTQTQKPGLLNYLSLGAGLL